MADNTWKMPPVRRGDIVDWFEGGVRNEDRGCAAVVLKVYHASVALKIMGIDNDFRLENARHIDDPNAREQERINEGAWSHRAPLPKPEKV